MPQRSSDRRRRSRRLSGYDYSLSGAYFVTLCLQDRRELFGKVEGGTLCPNAAGLMVSRWWEKLESKFPLAQTDEHVVMPNHFPGILILWPSDSAGPQDDRTAAPRACLALPNIVQWLKAMTTNDYIRHTRADGWASFEKRLWQRDFHDRVVRDNEDLSTYRRYIRENPGRWEMDRENPVALIIDPRWGGGRHPVDH